MSGKTDDVNAERENSSARFRAAKCTDEPDKPNHQLTG